MWFVYNDRYRFDLGHSHWCFHRNIPFQLRMTSWRFMIHCCPHVDDGFSLFLSWAFFAMASNTFDEKWFFRSTPNVNLMRISNKDGQTTGVSMNVFEDSLTNVLISELNVKVDESQTGTSIRWLRITSCAGRALKMSQSWKFTQVSTRSLILWRRSRILIPSTPFIKTLSSKTLSLWSLRRFSGRVRLLYWRKSSHWRRSPIRTSSRTFSSPRRTTRRTISRRRRRRALSVCQSGRRVESLIFFPERDSDLSAKAQSRW